MWVLKNSCMWKRLCLESCHINFWKWKMFSKYYCDSTIICDEVTKSYNEEIKTIPRNIN